MYLIKNLDEKLKTFQGEEITDGTGSCLTVRNVLVNRLGSANGQDLKSGEEMIRAYDLGQKIFTAEKDIELDDDQAKFIESLFSRQAIYSAIIVGYVLKKIQDSKVKVA